MNRKQLTQALAAPPDSLAGKVIEFLKANPGECLTRSDVAQKFGAHATMVDTLLAPAVHAKMLARVADDADGVTWKLQYPPTSFPAISGTLGASKKPVTRKPRSVVDLRGVVIEKGIPLIEPFKRAPAQWARLFDLMEPGDSFVVPNDARAALSHAQANYRKVHTKITFAIRKLDDAQTRIWRTA